MLTQEDSHVAHEWNVCHDAANDVLTLDIVLVLGVEFCVICDVVVAFCKEFCCVSVMSSISKCSKSIIPNCNGMEMESPTQYQTSSPTDAQSVYPSP